MRSRPAGPADPGAMSPSVELTIRRAEARDLGAIVAMLADDPLGARRESPGDPAPYRAAFDLIDADPNQLLAVAERHGQVIGTVQLTFIAGLGRRGATKALVQSVRIASALRGRGFGAVLMDWARDRARERGCALLTLTTHASRVDAQRFYDRLGLQRTHLGYTLAL